MSFEEHALIVGMGEQVDRLYFFSQGKVQLYGYVHN